MCILKEKTLIFEHFVVHKVVHIFGGIQFLRQLKLKM